MIEFWKNFGFRRDCPQTSLPPLSTNSIIPFQATFIFGASQFELAIKSHGHLKFFRPKF